MQLISQSCAAAPRHSERRAVVEQETETLLMVTNKSGLITKAERASGVWQLLCVLGQILLMISGGRICQGQSWFASPDCRGVQHKGYDGGDWGPDAALRAAAPCGASKVFRMASVVTSKAGLVE